MPLSLVLESKQPTKEDQLSMLVRYQYHHLRWVDSIESLQPQTFHLPFKAVPFAISLGHDTYVAPFAC